MKKNWLIIALLCTMGISCRQRPVKREPVKTVLEGKKVDVSSIYKKRSGDLVEALYDELVSGSEELTSLELQIKALQKEAPASLKDYKTFHEKNNAYYQFANKKINAITDSLLRKKMQRLIHHSRRQYNDSTGRLSTLDSLISKRTNTIHDLHIILKLVKTLPLIEGFQKSNLPPAAPVEGALYNLDSLIQRMDSLVQADTIAVKYRL